MLIFHAKHRPALLLDKLQVATSSVTFSASVKNIGVVLDLTLSLDKHVKSPDSEDPCPCICYLKA